MNVTQELPNITRWSHRGWSIVVDHVKGCVHAMSPDGHGEILPTLYDAWRFIDDFHGGPEPDQQVKWTL